MARKKIASEINKEQSRKLKKLITLIIFVGMLAIMACYGLGLDSYLHPKPQKNPEVSAWGQNAEENAEDDSFDFETAKENEGESSKDSDNSVIVTDPYQDTVTTEESSDEALEGEPEEMTEETTEENIEN